jgi:hypothetical protein
VTSRTIEPRARSLLSAAAVRNTSKRILALALDGELEDWAVERARLQPTADFVAQVVRDRYPTLKPPVHARWRHFVFAGRDLWSEIAARSHGVYPGP